MNAIMRYVMHWLAIYVMPGRAVPAYTGLS